MKAGITKKQIDWTVGIYPTSAEEFVTMAEPVRKFRRGNQIDLDTEDN